MDGSSFDRITRRLAVSSSRRGGIATIIAGALGIAGVSAVEARRGAGRRHEKLACRNDQTECTTNEQCCSGICRLKPGSGTEFRCVGKRKKQSRHRDDHRDGCVTDGFSCSGGDRCCQGLTCYVDVTGDETACRTCGALFDVCDDQSSPCCADLECEPQTLGAAASCCVGLGEACDNGGECCGYLLSMTDCMGGVCAGLM